MWYLSLSYTPCGQAVGGALEKVQFLAEGLKMEFLDIFQAGGAVWCKLFVYTLTLSI